jgi:hypothetical protein
MKWDKDKGTILTLVPAAPMSINSTNKSGEKIDTPSKERQWTDEMRMASNSKTFLRMEKSVRDAALMARIVEDLMVQAEDDGDAEMDEHLAFGVMHLVDMVKQVRDFYLNQGADQAAEDENAT